MIRVQPAKQTVKRQVSILEEDNVREKASDTFGPIITFMKVCGTYSERKDGQGIKTLTYHFGYCILMNILVVLLSLRYFTVFSKDCDKVYKTMGLVSFAYFYICLSSFCVIYLFSNCKYLREFTTTFDQYEQDYRTYFDIQTMRNKLKRTVIAICVAFVFVFACTYPSLLHYEKRQLLIKSHFVPFDHTSGVTFFVVGFVYAIFAIECHAILISNGVFQLASLYIIEKEFTFISKEIKKCILNQNFTLIFSLRKQHERLTELVTIGNPILKQNAAFLYVYGIPSICLMLYGVTTSSLDTVDVLNMSLTMGIAIIEVFIVTVMGAYLSEAAHGPFHELFKVDFDMMSQHDISQIQIFMARLSGPTIGVSVYGLFVIDHSAILMVLGTIISYAVIVVQLNLNPTMCTSLFINGTAT